MGTKMQKKIVIKYNNDEDKYYVESGAFDLGYLGCYEADKIEVDFNINLIDDEMKEKINENMDPQEIAEKLTAFYQERQQNLLKNQREVNNNFLERLVEDIVDCEYPFWENKNGEIESFIIKSRMPEDYEEIFCEEVCDKIDHMATEYYEQPNDGSIEKTDAESLISECFPMIDLKKLMDTIEAEILVFNFPNISFQCSSEVCDFGIACSAYAEITMDNSFFDWHNF